MSSDQAIKPESRVFDSGLETNLTEIAQHIFNRPPARPYSIGLQLDHPIDSDKTAETVLQEMLLILLLSGVEIKYGSGVTFAHLTQAQRETLRHYMWSVGFDPVVHLEYSETQPNVPSSFWIEFRPYQVGMV